MIMDYHDESDSLSDSDDTWGGRLEKLALRFSILGGNVQKVHFAPSYMMKDRNLDHPGFSKV